MAATAWTAFFTSVYTVNDSTSNPHSLYKWAIAVVTAYNVLLWLIRLTAKPDCIADDCKSDATCTPKNLNILSVVSPLVSVALLAETLWWKRYSAPPGVAAGLWQRVFDGDKLRPTAKLPANAPRFLAALFMGTRGKPSQTFKCCGKRCSWTGKCCCAIASCCCSWAGKCRCCCAAAMQLHTAARQNARSNAAHCVYRVYGQG